MHKTGAESIPHSAWTIREALASLIREAVAEDEWERVRALGALRDRYEATLVRRDYPTPDER